MAAVMHPQHTPLQPYHRSNSGSILIHPSPPIHSRPLSSTNTKFIPNTPSNNSLNSSNSSSGNNTDDTMSSHAHAALSQSWSVGSTPLNSVASRQTARSSSIPSGRRIRFAPLPDPRALESEEAADENDMTFTAGDYVPANLDGSDAGCSSLSSSSLLSPPSMMTSRDSSSFGSCPPSPVNLSLNTSQATLADSFDSNQTPTGPGSGASSPNTHKKSSSWASKPKKLFKPFLRRSSSPMPPASSPFGSNISAEDILTLGTINLFRSSSRESRESQEAPSGSSWGLPLNRWTSAGSYTGQKSKGKEWMGSPLSRTESTQSLKGDTRGRPIRPTTPKTPTQGSTNAMGRPGLKGTRMLNGRVYGGRRLNAQNTNLFATAKDEDPDFVEWGYGGMGSVKASAHGDKQWSKLQSGGTLGGSGTGGDDEDDGGGMAWAKRRREAREKAKKEAEEKAKAEAEAKENGETEQTETTEVPGQGVAPTEVEAEPESLVVQEEPATSASLPPVQDSPKKSEAHASDPISPAPLSAEAALTPSSTSPRSHGSPDAQKNEEKEEKHITTAVNVPAPARREHMHHRSSSAAPSMANSAATTPDAREKAMSPFRLASEGEVADTLKKDEDETASRSGSNSGSNSDSDGGEDEDEEDDEAEDEDDDEAEHIRKTALGAGVEKISRHKDER